MRWLTGPLLLLLLLYCSAPLRMEVLIAPESIERSIAGAFPLAEELSILTLEVTDPQIVLEEGADVIGLRLVVRVSIALLAEAKGSLMIVGKVRYVVEESTFYLREPRIRDLTIPGLDERYVAPVETAINAALGIALTDIPIHEFEGGATRMFLKSVVVRDGQIVAELGM